VVFAPSATANPPVKSCPSAAVVNAALGQKGQTPVSTTTVFSRTCTYNGSGIVPTRITFQEDTATSFAAGEKAVVAAGLPVETVHGFGKSAWANKSGGDLYVFTGTYTIKLLSPLSSLTKIEGLARKLL
jgi:hypothetical protein